MSQELVFQLGLSLIKGVGPVTAKKLIAYCGGYEAVFKEKISNLKKISTIGGVLAKEIQKSTVLKRAEEEIKYIEKHKISVLSFSDSGDQNICDHNKNSCVDSPYDFNDMVENYMSYSNPSCQNIFTKGQMGLMHGVLANQRVDLPYNADNTVGIHANENFHFSVYPQPAKDLLHIELTGANSQSNLQLIDISGKLIWEKDLNPNDHITLNLATKNYARGVYFLKFQNLQFNRIEKVILN